MFMCDVEWLKRCFNVSRCNNVKFAIPKIGYLSCQANKTIVQLDCK